MKKLKYLILSIISLAALSSCSDRDDIQSDIDDLNARLDKIEAQLPQINEAIVNYQGLYNGKYMVVGYTQAADGDYVLELSNGESFNVNVYSGQVTDEDMPLIEIRDGIWCYKYPGDEDFSPLLNGDEPVSATIDGVTPQFRVNKNGYWEYTYDGETWTGGIGPANPDKAFSSIFTDVKVSGDVIELEWADGKVSVPLFEGLSLEVTTGENPPSFSLGETKEFTITQGERVEKIVIETLDWKIKVEESKMTVTAPQTNALDKEYDYTLVLKIFSKEGYCRAVTIPVKLLNATLNEGSAQAWQNFLSGATGNVLLDYSYAGYNYGETAPADGMVLGYTVYNVRKIMEQNGLSAKAAFEKILDDNKLIRKTTPGVSNANARIVVYFPAGEYVLQETTDKPWQIIGGNFVIKGDGPDKTILKMTSHIGTSESTTGAMITMGHTQSPRNTDNSQSLGNITENAKKGDFTVEGSFSGVKVGDWVQLRLRSNNDDALKAELGPIYSQKTNNWSITKAPGVSDNNEDSNGIRIMEFHKVKSASATSVTFYDPIMSDINIATAGNYNDGWELRQYKCFENIGVEDLSFVGDAPTPYYHHAEEAPAGSLSPWMYDSSYKPVLFMRCVNSWIRNVKFTSVSEAATFDQSAFCSAYNITIDGKRGHSAVRAQESTRIFIGKVTDVSSDTRGNGQWHGCGVSKPSIGTVVWNTNWGQDACFESHATQPRATLFDNCRGGLVRYHAGGAENEAPNHLRDLTIWNLYVTGTTDEKGDNWSSGFKWWDAGSVWWKIYPPILVGVHGASVTWDAGTDDAKQYTYEESTGTMVTPESLYEAQLRNRLGYVPGWLNALK
ncbi:MAG: DUF4955 domain-containing protein [Candidatus Phocaeicola faecipullorum]|nr:DUF4955 domain-containing protein [Candidatus Phocaeicola faecipullorum]